MEKEKSLINNIETLKFEYECRVKMHELKMKELEYLRETEKIKHEFELTRGRIKTAEIRKSMIWKENLNRGDVK